MALMEKTADNTPIKKQAEKESGPPLTAKEEAKEFFKTALIAVVLAICIRSFFYEPFNIPSGSMKPTLLVGDYLFVSKATYGYSKHSFPFGIAPIEGRIWEGTPKRGDIVVFAKPTEPGTDFIKRVIGMPGETIQVKKGRVYINGTIAERETVGMRKDDPGTPQARTMIEYLETLPGGVTHTIWEESDDRPLDNTPLYKIPADHYFMMGDNRDNSADSRVMNEVGFVPFENFVGRADILFFSTNGHAGLFEFWKWPWTIRYERMFMRIRPSLIADTAKDEIETDTMAAPQ
jgi:signal peptidase I